MISISPIFAECAGEENFSKHLGVRGFCYKPHTSRSWRDIKKVGRCNSSTTHKPAFPPPHVHPLPPELLH